MVARASWKGFLRLSLVSVPVQAINASTPARDEIHFHQLHAPCHSRIRYQKTCPIHGEVPNDEIVMGYEHAKGKYVILEGDELKQARGEKDLSLDIDAFVEAGSIDPMYFDGRTYYLLPDGAPALKPYAVLQHALAVQQRWAVGTAVFSRRKQLLLVRAIDEALCVEMLHYASEIRGVEEVWGELSLPPVPREELKLAGKLIETAFQPTYDLAVNEDEYTSTLRKLIDAKVAGEEVVATPGTDEPPVINLMDALRKSVAKASSRTAKPPAAKKPKSAPRSRRKTG